MTRIMIADDHPIIVSGLESLLSKSGYEVAATVASGAAVLDRLAEVEPDILILDVQMPDGNGMDVLRIVRSGGDERAVVLLTAGIEDRQAAEAGDLRVNGLVLKDSPPDQLLHCLEEVSQGRRWIDPDIAERMRERAGGANPIENLSAREQAVVGLVVQGLRNREIASMLGIAEGTVKVHLHKVYEKLGVGSRTELVIYARNLAGN
jgi:two-component system nitrate/nitrite response regulator NarP